MGAVQRFPKTHEVLVVRAKVLSHRRRGMRNSGPKIDIAGLYARAAIKPNWTSFCDVCQSWNERRDPLLPDETPNLKHKPRKPQVPNLHKRRLQRNLVPRLGGKTPMILQ